MAVESGKAKSGPSVEHYNAHIAAYEREFKKWEKRGDKIMKIYKDDGSERKQGSSFNVLWSNVQTLKSATFARMPVPDVSRRFKDNDPVGRVAALMLERALTFEVQHYKDFGASLRQAVYDRFLPGRGVVWVRYEPTFKQVEDGAPEDGEQLTEDVETETETAEELDFECAPVDYVHWKDFGHSVARTWEEVSIVWRKVYLRRPALIERFGKEEGGKIPLDATPDEQGKVRGSTDSDSVQSAALLYEMWDKDTGQCLFLSKSLNKIVQTIDDPLQLEEFFPCPPPLFATVTTDSLVPLPDYTLYQDQARQLDLLSTRIDGLVKALRVRGVHDASQPALARLFTDAGDNELIPVQNWTAFAEKQGLKGAIDIVDLTPIAVALKEAYAAFEQVKSQIYELTGISDIIRGETSPSETATAQQIKNSYASMRLKTYQDEVERFSARLLQLKAQIICNHFDDETICQISACRQLSQEDQQLVPQALQMLHDKVTRTFSIEVSTDSMVYQDEQQDKQDRTEFLGAVSGYLEKAVPAMEQTPVLGPLAIEMLKFVVRGFRVGKSIEGTIDQAMDQLRQQAQQLKAPPGQAEAQADMQKAQMEAQSDQQIAQTKEQAANQRQQQEQAHEAQMEQMRLASEERARQADAANEQRLKAFQEQQESMRQAADQKHEQAMGQMQNMLEMILQRMKGQVAIDVAEVGAGATLQAAEMSAAKQGAQE